jgi:hypothetical protein
LALTGLAARRFNGDSVKQNFAKFGYVLIPLDLTAHIAHNLFHLLAEGKSIGYTIMGLFSGHVPDASTNLISDSTIQALQYVLIAIGTIGSIYTAYRIAKSNYDGKVKIKGLSIVYSILIILLGAANIILFTLPMAMRM